MTPATLPEMFDHVTIGAADREATRRFYRTVLATLGHRPRAAGPEWGDFSIQQGGDDRPVTKRLHIGFAAASHAHADAFWRAGVDAGYRDDGAPGPRAQYAEDYYGAFLLDPDGNSAEAVVHGRTRVGGCIDHIWVRVADRAARPPGERAGYHPGYFAAFVLDPDGHNVEAVHHARSSATT